MAEFIKERRAVRDKKPTAGSDGFDAMGKPIPAHRRAAGFSAAKEMGLDGETAWECVGKVANKLERDQPYEAMAEGMKYLDLTGTYRLFAHLLTG